MFSVVQTRTFFENANAKMLQAIEARFDNRPVTLPFFVVSISLLIDTRTGSTSRMPGSTGRMPGSTLRNVR